MSESVSELLQVFSIQLSLKGKVARRRNKELNFLQKLYTFSVFSRIRLKKLSKVLRFGSHPKAHLPKLPQTGVFWYNPPIMSWASQRKTTYILVFFAIVAVVLFFVGFSVFNKPASCFDGIQNQGETGIDCGGTCAKLCRAAYTDPSVQWTSWAKVTSSGTYNLLAYAENPNIGVGATNVPYEFKIYDKNNVLLSDTKGTASIPANNNFVVFVPNINIFDKIPARIDFQFSKNIAWQKVTDLEQGITVVSKTLVNGDTAPKIMATLQNNTLSPINNIQSVAVVSDANGNAIAFSKTVTDSIAPGGTADIVFTWPEPFSSPEYTIDIISQILPQ